ncbi:MAG: hypothetical protein GY820_30555, partial [Gammaproteobacteria bacterium]|nr:hypothetical protein [Gammaproteobacteria bacterium]
TQDDRKEGDAALDFSKFVTIRHCDDSLPMGCGHGRTQDFISGGGHRPTQNPLQLGVGGSQRPRN